MSNQTFITSKGEIGNLLMLQVKEHNIILAHA